jgi:glycosyltransferase involved in cell wall biosynthesis
VGLMKHIAIFLPSFGGGGAEKIGVTLANALADAGLRVDLVVATAVGPHASLVSKAVRVIDLRSPRVFSAILPLARYLRREAPVALLAMMTHANVAAVIAKSLARVKCRLVVSERSTISINARQAATVREKLIYRLAATVYPKADAIVAVSREAATDLAEFTGLDPTRVGSIYNPFDLGRIDELSREDPGHPWLSPGQPPVIIAVGRLMPEKDFPTLLRAFADLRRHLKARLLILGEGDLRRELEDQAKQLGLEPDEFQMPGFVSNPYSYLSRASLFVLSSRWEGLPGVLIEALACGVPVVSTECRSGPKEILEDGRWGQLVPVGDARALGVAMQRALSGRSGFVDGRSRAREFSLEKTVSMYLDILVPASARDAT